MAMATTTQRIGETVVTPPGHEVERTVVSAGQVTVMAPAPLITATAKPPTITPSMTRARKRIQKPRYRGPGATPNEGGGAGGIAVAMGWSPLLRYFGHSLASQAARGPLLLPPIGLFE